MRLSLFLSRHSTSASFHRESPYGGGSFNCQKILHTQLPLHHLPPFITSPVMSSSSEKYNAPTAFSPYLDTVTSLFHPMAGPVVNTYSRFHGWKESMGLVQPGTVENLTKEVSRRCS